MQYQKILSEPRRKRYYGRLMLRCCALTTILSFSVLAAENPSIDQALQHLYNFDFVSTHKTLDKYIEDHPQDPLDYSFRASTFLFYELDRMQLLEAEFLTDDEKLVEKKKKLKPDPRARANLLKALDDTT